MKFRLLLRQATSSLGASIAIILIVAIAAGLFTAWPRLSRGTFHDEIDFRMDQTPVAARALTGSQPGVWPVSIWSDDATYTSAMNHLEEAAASAGPALAPLLGDPELLITIAGPPTGTSIGSALTFDASSPRPSDLAGRLLQLRAIDSLLEHAEVVEGSAPIAWSGIEQAEDGSGAVVTPVEVMFSVQTAQRLGLHVGDELTDWMPEIAISDDEAISVPAVLTGLFEANDPQEAYWQFQISGIQPRIAADPNAGDFAIGSAYVHPDTAREFSVTPLLPTTDVWIPIAVGTDAPADVVDDLRDVVAREIELDGGLEIVPIRLQTALIDVLDAAIAAQRGSAAVLTLVAAGPVGVMFALLALTTRLTVSRRRATLALASARGGSAWQIRGALALEGLLLGVPAAALGAAAATLGVPETFELSDYRLPLLVALAPAAFLAAESLPNLRTQRQDLSARSHSRWRWVVEVLVIAGAVGAVYLMRSRGLQATTTTTVDPLSAATPLLIALAAAVLATRLFPVPMGLVHALMRRRPGLPSFLGSARALRERGAGLVPMLALLVGTSIAIFSTAMISTLSSGVSESTLASTGAEMRLAGPPYPDETVEQIEQVEGVAAVARVFEQPQTLFTVDTNSQQVRLYAVDTATLATVQSGVTGALEVPAGMAELDDGAVPVIVSSALAPQDPGLALSVRMKDSVPLVQVGTAQQAAGFAEGALWAVTDLDLLREITGQSLVPRLLLVDLDPDADVAATVTAVSHIVDGIGTITTADTQQEDFLASPAAISMQVGFIVALVVSVLQSVLALVLTLVLAAPERGRLVAVLRTLGLGARDARRLVSWELIPLAVVALVTGAALGLALPHLVVTTVDLSAFTGQVTPQVRYDWGQLGLVMAGVVAVIALTLLVASTVARRLSLSTLRIGDET